MLGKGMGSLKSVGEVVTLLRTVMSPPYDE